VRLSLKTAPAVRALDWLFEVKSHLHLDSDDERGRVDSILIPAAEQWTESATGRQLITATWTLSLETFPADGYPIVLPKPPLQSVTSVKYYDAAGVQQTWAAAANYIVIAPAGPKCGPGMIVPKADISYPYTYGPPYEIDVEFVAGYGDSPTAIPGLLKAGMLLLVAEQFERREEVTEGQISRVPLNAQALILPFLSEHC
jgi:uncharacterized phiE125 gp8 family phage protein